MAKECGFCSYKTDDDAAFGEHMRTVHGWGMPAAPAAPFTPVAAGAPAVAATGQGEAGVAKFCGTCGAPRDSASTNFCRSCGAPFTGTDTKPHEASPAFAPKGGFWRRTGAYLLDFVVLGVAGFILGLIIGFGGVAAHMRAADIDLLGQLLGDLLGLAYFLYFWSAHGSGQTPGMRALRLRVIRTDGTYMSVGRAFLRNIGLGISTIALGIGLLWVAFDKNKQGWHDKIADTFVIRTA